MMTTNTPSPIQKKVASVFIHVNDMEKAVAWYSRLLDIPFGSGPYNKIYSIQLENLLILLDSHRSGQFTPAGQALFSIPTDDIDQTYEYLKSMNVKIIGELERFPDISFVTIQDPDGNMLMIVEEDM